MMMTSEKVHVWVRLGKGSIVGIHVRRWKVLFVWHESMAEWCLKACLALRRRDSLVVQ